MGLGGLVLVLIEVSPFLSSLAEEAGSGGRDRLGGRGTGRKTLLANLSPSLSFRPLSSFSRHSPNSETTLYFAVKCMINSRKLL